jgi:hypothetical protein
MYSTICYTRRIFVFKNARVITRFLEVYHYMPFYPGIPSIPGGDSDYVAYKPQLR